MHRVHAPLHTHMETQSISVSTEICLFLSHIQIFATPWTVAHRAPLSVGFPRQEYWGGLPFPSPRDLPNPGVEPLSLAWMEILYHWAIWEVQAEITSNIQFGIKMIDILTMLIFPFIKLFSTTKWDGEHLGRNRLIVEYWKCI